MKRGLAGTETTVIGSFGPTKAFVPYHLPPRPPLRLPSATVRKLDEAMLALGRLQARCDRFQVPHRKRVEELLLKREAVMAAGTDGRSIALETFIQYEKVLGTPPMHQPGDVEAVVNGTAALEAGLRSLNQGMRPTNELLKSLHELLVRRLGDPPKGLARLRLINAEPAGQFRSKGLWFGLVNILKRPVMRAPPDLVPGLMAQLERFALETETGLQALTRCALAHAQFELIYPFAEEGPRMNLLHTNLLLHDAGLTPSLPLQLSQHFNDTQYESRNALNDVMYHGCWEEWVDYFATAITSAAHTTGSLLDAVEEATQNDFRSLERLGGRAPNAKVVLQHMLCEDAVTAVTVSGATGLARRTVSAVLNELHSAGVVHEVTGQGRNRRYSYRRTLQAVASGTGASIVQRREPNLRRVDHLATLSVADHALKRSAPDGPLTRL